ncbi:MAG: hypothetical protein AAF532_02670 [Planctomycetota bacterium]
MTAAPARPVPHGEPPAMTASSRDSLDLSFAYTSWITDEMRELVRQQEERRARSHRPPMTAFTTGTLAAVVGLFRFLVP